MSTKSPILPPSQQNLSPIMISARRSPRNYPTSTPSSSTPYHPHAHAHGHGHTSSSLMTSSTSSLASPQGPTRPLTNTTTNQPNTPGGKLKAVPSPKERLAERAAGAGGYALGMVSNVTVNGSPGSTSSGSVGNTPSVGIYVQAGQQASPMLSTGTGMGKCHYSPYHTRSTPHLTNTSSGSSSNSPLVLTPSGSSSGLPAVSLREKSTLGKPRRSIHSPAASSSLSSLAPPLPLTHAPSELRNSETGSVPKYRSGLSVEGILMQSSAADKVNTAGNGGFMGMGGRGKGKGIDYGDRFIPQRSNADLHASYSLLPDGPEASSGFVPSGIHGEGMAASLNARRAEIDRSRKKSQMAGGESLREDADRTYSNLLKTELFGPASIERPSPTHTSSAPTLPIRPPTQPLSSTPFNHHPSGSNGDFVLPPLPAHSPSTPRTHPVGAFAAVGPRHSRSTPIIGDPPVTPTKRRVLDFSSPTSALKSSPTSRTGASPGNISLGQKSSTGLGRGLDDMMHEKYSLSPMGRDSQKLLIGSRKPARYISKTPFKVLDAPDLADDFYLNLVSWSHSDLLAVGLRSSIYLWSAATQEVTRMYDFSDDTPSHAPIDEITGVEWTNRGSTLAIGTKSGKIEIWDCETSRRIRTMTGHTNRVGALAWNGHILSTGSRDRTILHRDTRMREHHFETLKTHRQEVCGLKWNFTTNQLASGGNDNKLYIWDRTNPTPLYKFTQHCAAVKAIAWSPHTNGLLATGGGTADKKIRYWNTITGNLLSEWDTGSQVCNLVWSKNSSEIVSTHGYSGGAVSNQICLWKYPSMTPVATLTGHTYRVLYLAMSPDGQTIVTGAGDETLRFWNAFQRGRNAEAPREERGEEATVLLREKKKEESELNPFGRIR